MFDEQKTRLTQDNLDEIRRRFGRFHDALIHEICYKVAGVDERMQATIILAALDSDAQEYKDVIVKFSITGITSFILRDPTNYTVRVIGRANIGIIDEKVYIDFFSFHTNPNDLASYDETPAHSTQFQIFAEDCWVEILDDI